MMRARGYAVLLSLCLVAPFARAAAQGDPRLERLDEATRPIVVALIDSARAVGLPVNPLVERALEGAIKGAPGATIATAVRRLAADLGRARDALGPGASPAELDAGAAALRAGAGPDVLTRLRRARGHRPVTMALAVLTDLVARGVPIDTATTAVLTLAATARDQDLVDFRRAVERDIAIGAPPAAAASIRVNAAAREMRPGRP
ncbi:MAG TPA: hypothetical protein VFD68_05675 [Gemmatimonadales bacterium]|jgi:hypothetical protein|nr:hypothetical protein [Gemmatimonadales bacterium]